MKVSINAARTVIISVILALASAVFPAAATAAATTSGANIRGVASSRCLDVRGASTTAGTGIDIYDCRPNANQQWIFTAAGELRTYAGPPRPTRMSAI